ncbi:MAG: Ig-like domain-containing protein, partial [Pantoea agglomerans]
DPAPTFTGKAEKGSLVTLYDNGILLATVTADAQGEWSYTPTTNLLEGTHGITATATLYQRIPSKRCTNHADVKNEYFWPLSCFAARPE